ncbi:MAG TPA: isoleucine--tRNA ligase [Gaiellaceae bacterium]|nr:isoleucine--tRNA ligase [Gaiellaceae bacterium]
MTPIFTPLPDKPDHDALELAVLERWERERTFERLRERNRGGPTFSFVDGPITANNPMGVHHAWGRTLKDVFQRYKALRGFDQRYQNGFDCQGLWVEVEVEKALGLNSKREIEEYGLAEFAARCRERVAHYSEVITRQSRRLGMWMDWDNDYYTFTDTNIEYIWRFLKTVHERGWLYQGHRSTVWCPRCGTSISQHEVFSGEYVELEHPSLYVRFPLKGREREALVVWTTTPWTLPANVAAAVNPQAQYGLTEDGEWWATARKPDATFVRTALGAELVGLEYEGPFDHVPAQEGVVHRVIPWDDVALDEGTGIVHIAPGAGAEDFELSRVHDLPVLAPLDEAGRMLPGFGFDGLASDEVAEPAIEDLRARGLLVEAGTIVHRYPTCWRCMTPLVFRVVDDWFISADEIRQPMLDANATVEWTPAFYGKRMEDWLRNMGDWNISRKRYFGLPLPFYPCACGHLTVVGSRRELEERAVRGLEQLQELHRPWIDEVVVRCEACGEEVRRIPEVGDAWLDAGIVPLSTLGWQNPHWIEHGYATGAGEGLSGADLPDHAYWERWFPADWVSEMREQIRTWFYSISFMSVTLVGQSPYRRVLTYEKLLDETGREMHRSWGNAIEVDEAFERMGADVMRWQYCSQPPSQNLKFGYGPAQEIKRRLLTLWHSAKFLVDYANVEGWRPRLTDLEPGPEGELQPLDRWLLARTAALVREAEAAYESFLTVNVVRAFESFVDDVSNWYIRRSRRRFWDGDETAFRVLWNALVQGLRVVSPLMPFLADHLWRELVEPCEGAPDSVFLAGWPEVREPDADLLAEIAELRRVVELGRQARAGAGVKLRQPLRALVVDGAERARAHAEEIAEELRVKEVLFAEVDASELRVRPNLPVLGPKLGRELQVVRAALERGEFEELPEGRFRVAGRELGPDEVLVERAGKEGFAVAAADGVTVALDTRLDDELVREGRVYELVHRVNTMRKEAGLELGDRIALTLAEDDADLLAYRDWIARETLAVSVDADGGGLRIARVEARASD